MGAAGAGWSAGSDRRSDIQAMRAIAVLAVCAFHLFPRQVPGGFVGVDIFFVISGFLIVSHLVDEVGETGRIRLGSFWARRAKRLLPGALLVLLVTSVAIALVVPMGERESFLREVVASTFYVQNWALASQAVDYWNAGDAVSPVQHFWSLSVEEQFYVGVPILLFVVGLLTRRSHRVRRLAVLGALTLAAVVSFVFSLRATAANAPVAYFSTFARAWEFLLGGLLAFLPTLRWRHVAAALGWAGGGVMVASAFLVADTGAFPGYLATAPTIGAAAAIIAGGHGLVAHLAKVRPVAWLGDQSYEIYLWHWPPIALLPVVTNHALTLVEKVVIFVVTLVLAWLLTRFVENPVRFSPRLLGGRRRPLIVGVSAGLGMVMVAGCAWSEARIAVEDTQAQQSRISSTATTAQSCLVTAVLTGRTKGCRAVSGRLFPSVDAAHSDKRAHQECFGTSNRRGLFVCHFGPSTGAALRVLAVGDSHNHMYVDAYAKWATKLNWHIDVASRSGCWWSVGRTKSPTPGWAAACTQWRAELASYLAAHPPYDVIVTSGFLQGQAKDAIDVRRPGQSQTGAELAHLETAWRSQTVRGTVVVPILDVPKVSGWVACARKYGVRAETSCAIARSRALAPTDVFARAAKAVRGAVAVPQMRNVLCDARRCSPVAGHVVAYMDGSHLNSVFVRVMSDQLATWVQAAVVRARSELAHR